MLDSFERFVLLYDLTLRTARQATEFAPFADLARAIEKRVKDDKATIIFGDPDDEGRAPWYRIKDAKVHKLGKGNEYLILLFSVGDPRAANPSFEHSVTAKLRTVAKQEKEGKAVTAHCIIAVEEAGPRRYKMVFEDVRGLGRTRIRDLLAKELKAVSEGYGLEYTNNSGEQVDTYIIPDLEGYRSETIGNSLKRSTISGVYLIDSSANEELDEVEGANVTRKELKVDVAGLSTLEKVRAWAAANHYDKMRLVWNDPEGTGKPERAMVDTTQKDVQDNYFVRQYKVSVKNPLDEAVEKIRYDLIDAMFAQVPTKKK